MASLIEELIDVLEQEQEQYDELLKVALEKTGVIVSNDLNRLQEIAIKEQDILDVVVNLDRKRETCMTDIASVLGKKASRMTVKHIIELMEGQPQYQRPLAKLHDSLETTVKQLRQVSVHNQDLLTSAIDMTEFEINLVQSIGQAPETANYSRDSYSGDTLGAALPRFDTKQ